MTDHKHVVQSEVRKHTDFLLSYEGYGKNARSVIGNRAQRRETVKMTRDAAILKMIDVFRKDRDIDEGKVMHHLQVLLDTKPPDDERSFDEKERERDHRIAQLDAMTADELDLVKDCIRALERIAPD